MAPGRPFLLPLQGSIKRYAWGSRTFLAALRGDASPRPEPEAELWIGAHPQGSAEVEWGGARVSLRDAIAGDPRGFLGAGSTARFGVELPFLLKVLAIERPLSLQVHPDRELAAAGFRRERAAGVAPEAGSYRDERHKPELLVALEPTWVLSGLREPEEIRSAFAAARLASFAGETAALAEAGAPGVRDFLAALLGLATERRRRLVAEARRAAGSAREGWSEEDARDAPLFWVGKLLELHPGDPAALAPLLLHLVRLQPGQGIFQRPGVLHCYLEGAGVEAMASSDNVVRAGLTEKTVDVAEALAVADLAPAAPATVEPLPVAPGLLRYAIDAGELELLRLDATGGAASPQPPEGLGPEMRGLPSSDTLQLGICTGGVGVLVALDRGERLELRSGAAFAVRPGAGPLLVAGDAGVYLARIGAG